MEGLKTELVVKDANADLDMPGPLVGPNDSTAMLDHLHIEVAGENEAEFVADTTDADLARPDSAMSETNGGSPSALAGVLERSKSRTTDESETEFEADFTKSILDLVSGDGAFEKNSDTVTVLEHPEGGNYEEPKVKEPATETTLPNLNIPETVIDRKHDGSPSETIAVLEHLGNGECEETKTVETAADASSVDLNLPDSLVINNVDGSPSDLAGIDSTVLRTVEATNGDLAEEMVVDTGVGCGRELMPVPLEDGASTVAKKTQDIPENPFENGESKSESIYNTEETEGDHHLEKDAIRSPLEGETEYLLSSKPLPLEVGKNVIQLQCESTAPGAPNGVCFVNIVGTAHVSKASCEEVKNLIRHVKPEVVFLELCSSRTNILLPRELEVPTFNSMIESYRKKEMNIFGLMYSWFLAKVGEKLEILPGTEFRIAYEEAVRCGAVVTLGDRPIQVTLKRTWGRMSTWHKIKLLFGILTATFNLPSADEFQAMMEKMEQSDEVTLMIQELSKTFPTLSETLVAERDLYMVASLRTVARRYSSVVAVVGRGHLSGIEKHWKEDIDVHELLAIPVKKPVRRIWFWSTVALGVGGVVVGVNLLRHR